ncbi:MAG TPA: terminase small subunit [Acidobacteriota bacterium]
MTRKTTTLKQKAFIAEYLANGGNGTQAALKVYGTTDPGTAAVIANENLRKPNLKNEIRRLMGKVELREEDAMLVVKDALTADKTDIADHPVRLRGADMVFRLKGTYPKEQPPPPAQGSKHLHLHLQSAEQVAAARRLLMADVPPADS